MILSRESIAGTMLELTQDRAASEASTVTWQGSGGDLASRAAGHLAESGHAPLYLLPPLGRSWHTVPMWNDILHRSSIDQTPRSRAAWPDNAVIELHPRMTPLPIIVAMLLVIATPCVWIVSSRGLGLGLMSPDMLVWRSADHTLLPAGL